jgi:release factor glutamine methyltransferase
VADAGSDAGSRLSALGSRQTIGGLVEELAKRLHGVEDPPREARELLAALLDQPKHWPLLHENKWVEADLWRRACAAADKYARGAPLGYAVGHVNFRNLTLDVDERVLIPRPETELLVDLVLERCGRGGIAVDIGTGSGAIAIALATEGKFERVIATDISADALDVACANAQKFCDDRIQFVHGNLLHTLGADAGTQLSVGHLRAVVCNPPYVSFDEISALSASVRDWEPMIALLSGQDGLATTVRLVRQAATRLEPDGLLALEVDARRASLVAEVVSSDARYQEVSVNLDLAGRERFVLARRARRKPA